MKLRQALVAVLLPLAAAACTVPEDDGRLNGDHTPGSEPWNHSEDVTCESNDQCGAGEVCEDGVCQMNRCAEQYDSAPPMGQNRYFGTDGEFAIISDNTWIDAFEPQGGYINSWDLQGSGATVIDVTGGPMTPERPHTVAVAVQGSSVIHLNGPMGITTFDIGTWPTAIDSGDVDGDGLAELVAFGEDGTITVCNVDSGSCMDAKIDGVIGKDVEVADIDGDGFEEPMFLIDHQGESELIVWNVDANETGQEESFGWGFNFPVRAIGAGKVSGGATAEIVMLEDGGWWGWTDDKLHVFAPASEQFMASHNVDGHTKDVAVGDRNSDDKDEIGILRDGQQFELLSMGTDGSISSVSTNPVTVGEEAQRIAFVDWNGDSASGRLLNGPELIPGKAVPVAALMFPPYEAKVAVGALSANITLGDTESIDESYSDTLSLNVGMGLSFGAEAAGFKAKVGGFFNQGVSVTQETSKSFQVGARYWILAQPDLHGVAYAPVIMSCGCYHRYQYVLEDPSNLLGGSGQTVDVFVPVGGQTQLWSSARYNAMAENIPHMPRIEIPIRVGDVGSYPDTIQTIDGAPIQEEDMLFPKTSSYTISDVGFVSFWLVNGESETNSIAESATFGLNTSFGAFGADVSTEVTVGVTQGYSLRVGTSQLFAGGIPPVPDNPDTPEDEYEVWRYSFTPFVYRHRYVTESGDAGALYVMHFAVGQ